MADWDPRVNELFLNALEQTPGPERVAFLDKACGADAALRRAVEEMLAAHDQAGNFLEGAAFLPPTRAADDAPLGEPTAVPAPPAEKAGSRIGPYKLLQEIGEGGMGTVFMAEQTQPVQRKVALKFIKAGLDSRQIIARFEAERQALALMDHPNIAKVLDAGATAAGQPYFVMELVKGVPFTQYCDKHRLTLRQRVELFVPICQAVQHAHQKGIIHRDLKPSNVLVAQYDGKPVPKIIDFGIAKATGQKLTDKTLFTDFGAVVGTLEYMSPEQAELNQLDIDTRSDIYALGVMLYELLTGTTPLERKRLQSAALLECLRIIREEDPPRPSARLSSTEELPSIAAQRRLEPKKLSGVVRGDLDWIVMKCLEKDRNRRYETANGLAMDVQRYLADEPVLATPPSAAYRLRKFARRHKAGLRTTAALLLVFLLAASGLGWALWDRAEQEGMRQQDLAKRAADTDREVSVALARAAQLADQARQMPSASSEQAAAVLVVWRQAEDALAQASAALRTGMADDELRGRVAALASQVEGGRQQTERGRAYALRKEKLFRDLDEARMARSVVVDNRFDYAGAAAKYAAAFAAYDVAGTKGNTAKAARLIAGAEPEVREALIVALHDWAYAKARAESAPAATNLRTLAEAADTDVWRKRFRAAVIAQDRAALRDLSAEARRSSLAPSSLFFLASSLDGLGERDEAKALLRFGRGCHPSDFWMHFDLGSILDVAKDGSPLEIEEAIGCYRAALALRPNASSVHNNLGRALEAKNQLDEAIDAYKKAIDIDPKFAIAHFNLGNVLLHKNQLDDAIAYYNKAIALDSSFARAHVNLGLALSGKNQLDEAIDAYKKAIDIDPKRAKAHNNLGIVLSRKHEFDDAIDAYRKAIDIDQNYAEAHCNLGYALRYQGKLAESLAEYRLGHDLGRKQPKWSRPSADWVRDAEAILDLDGRREALLRGEMAGVKATDLMAYALYRRGQGKLDEAVELLQQTVALQPDLADAHGNLSWFLRNQGKWDKAFDEAQKAIELNPRVGWYHNDYGWLLENQGQLKEALDEYRKATKLPNPGATAAQNLKNLEALVALIPRLETVRKGETKPTDAAECISLAQLAKRKKQWVLASRLYEKAFADKPELAEDFAAFNRYYAACSAVLASASKGEGEDTGNLDDKERARLRQQAITWLRADLAYRTKQAASGKESDRQEVQQRVKYWQVDPGLAGIRDQDAIAKLPADERAACQQLWADVAKLLEIAGDAK